MVVAMTCPRCSRWGWGLSPRARGRSCRSVNGWPTSRSRRCGSSVSPRPHHRTASGDRDRRQDGARSTFQGEDRTPSWSPWMRCTQLFQACKNLPWTDRRGRLPEHLRRPPGRTTSNPRGLGPAALGNENRLHWVRDVTYDEDRSQVRTGNSPQVMATLRSTAISLLRLTGVENIAQRLRLCQRPRNRPQTGPDLLKHDFAGALPLAPGLERRLASTSGARDGGPARTPLERSFDPSVVGSSPWGLPSNVTLMNRAATQAARPGATCGASHARSA